MMIDVLSIFVLGLAVIVHPCTIAPNLAAMAFIKGKSDGRAVLWMYILGHTLLYIALGMVLAFLLRLGIIANHLEEILKQWGQPVLVAVFAIAGLMLVLSSLRNHEHHHTHGKLAGKSSSFVSGVLVALAFCPEAAIAFFGVMLPLTVTSRIGYLLPLAFAIGTALPLAVIEWLFHKGTMNLVPSIKTMTRFFNLAIGIIFLIAAVIVYLL